jgi:hypothetical protein
VVVWLLLRRGATMHAIYYCYECESDEDDPRKYNVRITYLNACNVVHYMPVDGA